MEMPHVIPDAIRNPRRTQSGVGRNPGSNDWHRLPDRGTGHAAPV